MNSSISSFFRKNSGCGVAIFGLMWLCSCAEPPPLKLTLEQREWVDTLYLRRIDGMSARMDSQCVVKRAQVLPSLTDSILEVRRKEEEALRAKYQK